MKRFLLFSAIATLTLSNSDCNSKKASSASFRGRLEIKGICSNYTIKLIIGKIDTSAIATEWTDPNSGIAHTNVFGLSDPCTFPVSINQGDEFDFILDKTVAAPCVVCEAYYPTPPRSLNIKVLKK